MLVSKKRRIDKQEQLKNDLSPSLLSGRTEQHSYQHQPPRGRAVDARIAYEESLGWVEFMDHNVLQVYCVMYTILHETDDSTTVNLSECGKFFPEKGLQLVTIGGKYLRIFRANPYALLLNEAEQWTQTTRLECLLAVRFLAPVRSLATAKILR